MKAVFFTAVILLGLLIGRVAEAQQRYLVFVPATPDRAIADVAWDCVDYLATHASAGDHFEFYNAVTQERLGACKKPSGPNNVALRAMAPHMRGFESHLLAGTQSSGEHVNRVHIPAVVRTVQAVIRERTAADRPIRVIILGSLYLHDPQDPAATFGRGEVPNDGAINARSIDGIYGTADRHGLLDGVFVDIGFTDTGLAQRDIDSVSRFWSLFLGSQGAVLTSCQPASRVAAENALKGLKSPLSHPPLDASITRALIVKVGTSAIDPVGETSGAYGPPAPPVDARPEPSMPQTDNPEHVRPDSTAPPSEEVTRVLQETADSVPLPATGSLSIAAVWTTSGGDADVDLYVRPRQGVQELYFANKTTPEGRYLRDILTATPSRDDQSWRTAWECVDIDEASLPTTTIWLNLYDCSASRVDGIVRVVFADRSADVPFTFRKTPSKGGGRDVRASHQAWRRIELPEYLFTGANGP